MNKRDERLAEIRAEIEREMWVPATLPGKWLLTELEREIERSKKLRDALATFKLIALIKEHVQVLDNAATFALTEYYKSLEENK